MQTFSDLLLAYRAEVTPTKRGARQEEGRIDRLLADPISQAPLDAMKRADIRAWRARYMATGITGSTYNRSVALIGHALKWGLAEHDVGPGRTITVGLAQPENAARTRRLRPGEYDRLIDGAGTHWLGAWITLAVESAMRRGSIASLTWEMVDLRNRVARLPMTKTGAQAVPLSTRAMAALEKVRGGQARIGLVFGVTADAATRAFARLCKRAGISGLRLHDLRAECVSSLFERGWAMNEVAAVSGHRTTQMLMRYARHNDPAALAQRLG